MTEQSKIDRKGSKRTSLFERADEMFGLEKLGSAPMPANLRDIEPKVPRAVREAAQVAQKHAEAEELAETQSVPQAAPQKPVVKPQERKVILSGPRQSINREILREEGLIVPEDPVTGLLEEFRIVKRELLADARASSDPSAQRVLVCSPLPGEGKTYCAINLAIALAAERDVEVLLIDADVMNPSVAGRLGIEAGRGLMDTLADSSLHPERLAIGTDIEGLYVLPAGTSSARDAEYLASARTGEVFDRL
ncbi:MAG: capsular biosynthesis protein, partial [Pseudomonadota bacterium]